MQHSKIPIRELLTVHGFKFSKSMGQNFLTDINIPAKIVSGAGVDKSCGVLEIGSGLGILTTELAKYASRVTTVELDKRLIPILKNILAEYDNVALLQGDILKLDIKKVIADSMPELQYHVCANLPYNITTPVITTLIEADIFGSITVMIQKEVAQRICASPGSPEYGSFTVYANYHTEPVILFDVPPECFTPRPKVTSSVIKMTTRLKKILTKEKEISFFKVVRAAFGQRRKTLANALHAVYSSIYSKDEITKIIENCGFDVRIRGEKLSIDDFIKLTDHFDAKL